MRLRKLLLPISLVLATCFFGAEAKAQTTVTIGTGTTSSSGNTYPIYRSSATSSFNYSRTAMLYTTSDLSSIPNGAVITAIAFNKTTTASLANGYTATFNIFMKNSAATSYTGTTPWATYTSGATQVFQNTALNSTDLAASPWLSFTLTTPFIYTGGTLEVLTDWAINSGSGTGTSYTTGSFTFGYTSASATKVAGTASSSPLTTNNLSSTGSRINNIKITYTPPVACSAAPMPGTAIVSDASPCSGTSVIVSLTGGSAASGISYQLQSSPNNLTFTSVGTPSTIPQFTTTPSGGVTYYRIVSTCTAASASANSASVTVTGQTPVTTYPYTESFDPSGIPACWVADNAGTSTYNWTGTAADANYGAAGPVSGSGFLYLYVYLASTSSNPYTLTTSSFTLSGAPKQLEYFYFLGDNGYKGTTGATGTDPYPLQVEISSNGGSTWTTLYQHSATNSNFATTNSVSNWTPNTINLTAYAGQTVQFRFRSNSKYIGSGTRDQGLDEFTISNIPTCIKPGGLTASGITGSTATISWTAPTPAPALGYQYEVRSSGAPGSGPAGRAAAGSTAAGVTSASIGSLSPITNYSFYVRGICTAGDTSLWTYGYAFMTDCATFPTPYSESFNANTLPTCWTNDNSIGSTSSTMFWKFSGTPGYGTTSNGRPVNSYAWVDASSPYTGEVILTSPFLNLTGLYNATVRFDWFKNHSSSSTSTIRPSYPNNNLKLEGYNGTNWITLFDDTSNATSWRTQSITLPPSFSGATTTQFRFTVDKSLSGFQYDDVLLDSFAVTNAPCPVPGNISVSNITAGGATVSWTAPTPASASGYQYEVRTSGAAGSGATGLVTSGAVPAGVTSANVTGLMANTNVMVYVRGLCTNTYGSVWTAGFPFQTSVCTMTTDLGADTAICSAGSLTLDAGNAGSTYRWSTGATTQTVAVSAIGSYSVVVNGPGGCIARDTIFVTHLPPLEVDLGVDTTICAGSRLILNAGYTGSTYLWNTGAISQTVSVATAGTYSVQLTDVDGCSGRDTIIINVLQAPTLSLGNDTTLCVGSPLLLNAGNAGSTYSWNTGATTRTIPVLVSGTYSVAVVAPSGCSVKDTIKVTMNPLPEAGTIAISGQAPTFTFSVIGSAHVANSGWIFGDGSVSTAQSPTHTYAASGTYTVTYFVANACGVDSTTRKLTIGAGGVQNTVLENEIQLFPNPANHFVTIQNDATQAMKAIRILDMAGAIVRTIDAVNGTEQRIDISQLAAGNYMIRIELEGGTVAIRKMQIVR